MSGRSRVKISNICTVQRPTPRSEVRCSINSSSVSIVAALAVDFMRRRRFMSWQTIKSALREGATGSLEAVAACACAGILVGVFILTGLGNRFVDLVLAYGQQHLVLTLIIVMLVTILLGFPLPTVPAYILTAAVGAPVMVKLGVPMLAAHMFIMYYACVSTLTPPVALAAFTAAGIAGSDPDKTGWLATRLSIAAYIVPFVFIFNPAILWAGPWYDILRATAMGFASAYGLAGAANSNFNPLCRIIVFAAAIAVLNRDWTINLGGIAVMAAVIAWQNLVAQRAIGSAGR